MRIFLDDIIRARAIARRRLAGSGRRRGADSEDFVWLLCWADLASRATGESRRIVLAQMRAALKSAVGGAAGAEGRGRIGAGDRRPAHP